MAGPIALLTDFGLDDAYVGTMKGVILRINPTATIVDLCHAVAPQAVAEGAFLLATSYRYFAPETIFVAVVDPGVGSERRPIALRTPRGTFVGPDNGLFGMVVRDFGVAMPRDGGRASLGGSPVVGVVLAEERYFLPNVSATFHGRDIFAPVAAHLSLGTPVEALGPPLTDLITLPMPRPEHRGDRIVGHIVHVDRFGNLITDVTEDDLKQLISPVVEAAGQRIVGISHHYAERTGLLALVGSSGRLEIALNGGSAAITLGLHAGDSIILSDEQ